MAPVGWVKKFMVKLLLPPGDTDCFDDGVILSNVAPTGPPEV